MNSPKRLPLSSQGLRPHRLKNQIGLPYLEDPQLFKIRSTTARTQKKPQSPVSPALLETRSQFFETLKTLPSQDRKGLLVESPTEVFLKECEEKCLNPLPIGTNTDSGSVINLANYSMGDNYAEAFGKSLKKVSKIEKLNISANSLSPRGLNTILHNISSQPIKELSIKDNTFDIRIVEPLLALLNKPSPSLRYLNLENTKISDRFVGMLCNSLSNNHTLNFLGLAKNALGYVSCKALKGFLLENQYLKQLDFHWNNSKDFGAMLIFEALTKNDSLKELDLSWNSIGKNKDLSAIRKISQSFVGILGLVHLDLSFNFLTPEECEIFGEGLLNNSEILGIHFLGNQGIIDSQGFIIPRKDIVPSRKLNLFFRLFDTNKAKKHEESLCWICEGWKEMDFIWDPVMEKGDAQEVYIHLDCDGYKPESLTMENGTLKLSRVLPPGEVKFFFSDGKKIIESSSYEKEKLENPLRKTVEFVKNHAIEFLVKNLQKTKVTGHSFSPNLPFNTTPRRQKFAAKTFKKTFKRINWRIQKSLFRDYKKLTDSYISECSDFDWQESKLNKLIKNEPEKNELREVIKKNFIKITEIFRFLASQSGNEYLTVGNNVLTDYFYQTKVFDSLFSLADLGVNWNAVTVHRNRQAFNPLTSLVRYEFVEILVRVANDRYLRNRLCNSLPEALDRLMKEKLYDSFEYPLDNNWRSECYLTEEVDIVYKIHRPILEYLFKKYSGRKTMPGQKPFMSLDEFKELCITAELLHTANPDRDIEICFSAAMMIQIDEINQKKHVEMNFLEFLEALARVSTYRSLDNVKVEGEVLPRQIEANLNVLIKLCSKSLQENFKFPTYETYKAFKYKPRKYK